MISNIGDLVLGISKETMKGIGAFSLILFLCNGDLVPASNTTTKPTTGPTIAHSTAPTTWPIPIESSEPTTGQTKAHSTGPSIGPTTWPITTESSEPTTGQTKAHTTGPSIGPTTWPITTHTTGPTTAQPGQHVCAMQTCSPSNITAASDIYQYCVDRNLTFSGRCCLNGTQIDGIDLSSCKITFDILTKYADELENVQIISLAGVTEPNCSDHSIWKYFQGQTSLNTLILSKMCTCPGGMSSWESITLGDTSLTCDTQRDRCNLDDIKCPLQNTQCQMNGPGADLLCQCSDGYFGYKCLRKGNFPIILFGIVTAITTGMASMLLWGANRKLFINVGPNFTPVEIS
ncbi:unnamed protein product [Owenia fusiformis]|uniref:Uncharacterized protein n=1 Tax=Owenia fusiformis TaxID=6347 RepID=A0A8J1XGY5_OWEFU|nr:unnamed protein product [Owenia fusiformis]